MDGLKMNGDQNTQNDAKIISLHRFRDGQGLSPLRQAEAYWSALRTDATIPSRSQIDPSGLANILQYTFILERIAPGIAKFRLAGQHIIRLAGMEVRGMPLSTFFTPSGRIHISAALEHVFDAPAVAELSLQRQAKRGQPAPEARMMLLPLQTDAGDVSRALGVLVADDTKTHTNLNLSVLDTVLRPVSGYQHVEHPKTETLLAENAEPSTGLVSHLRLV